MTMESRDLPQDILSGLQREFNLLLESEDKTSCVRFALEGLGRGRFDLIALYDDVLTPSLRSVPVCRDDDRNCIWHEHVKSGIVRTIIENCHLHLMDVRNAREAEKTRQEESSIQSERITEGPARISAISDEISFNTGKPNAVRQLKRPSALVVCPERELHELGSRMAADAFTLAGFRTIHTGANTPREALVMAAFEECPVVVAISVTDPYNLVEAEQALRLLHDRMSAAARTGEDLQPKNTPRRPKIIAGGHAFRMNPDAAVRLGAEMIPDSFGSLLAWAIDQKQKWDEEEGST